ncbi:Homeobox-leucine zipper protein HDG3 [Arabidopsis thaliana]|uniref:HDG3 n=3 Tax=Arabidopsis TaxID=3701 RepID=A0A178VYN2_ARATH|nr:START domain [Arabidopsis thaliana x Arabidopsis arenosa]KAG7642832.1 START domain [Arabidopsis suecica]OAP11410.1 HDG3 [Arabidopsis thaliana]
MSQSNMVPVANNGDNNNDNENNNNNNNGGTDNTNAGNDSGDQDFDSGNTSSGNHGEGLGNNQAPRHKKKKYNRHTQLQISEMEAFFRECPHPDDKQRYDLSAQLGLDPVQIKFWFQNKRTQNKNQQERFENSELRNLNNHLRSENQRLREAIHQALCPKCGGQTAIGEMTFEEHHLRILNARLTEEIKQLSVTAEKISRLTGIPVRSHPRVSPPNPPPNFEFGMGSKGNVGNHSRETTGPADANTKPIIMELAFGAMEEFLVMAQVAEPLWMGGFNGTSLALNLDEYEKTFRTGLGPRLGGFRTEASRETALVAMCPTGIVEMLMQENLWSTMFAGIVGRARTHEQIMADAAGNFNGNLQIMSAEYQVLSPLVTTRESYFVRYCKQQGEGLWAVVDISIDHLLPNINLKCRRRPSGCLIQEMHSGYSKVTWVEHVEVDDAGSYSIFEKLICTGQAFAANRWVGTLVRQCERISSILSTDFQSVDSGDHITLTNHGKMSMLKIAERIARTFFAGMTNATGSTIFSGVEGEDIRVMTMKSVNDPGKPPGVIICAATSFWLPAPPNTVFDFLREATHRHNWDVLCNGEMMHKIAEITNGIDKRNCASLLRHGHTSKSKMMIVQETSTDPTASFVLYAPVDMTSMDITLHGGGDPDFVVILPSGFAIFPDGTGKPGGKEGGSLLTISFQMLVESGPEARLSVSSVATTENLIRTTVRRIKDLFPCQTA